jgi:hypothetical protein
MAGSSRNIDTGLCRFTPEDLRELGRHCGFTNVNDCRAARAGCTIDACPPNYIPAYSQCFLDGNLRLPLTRFLCSVFEYYNLRFWQLGPLAVARITCFEMQCRALGVTPAIGLFRHFFSLDGSKNTYSFLLRRISKKHVTPPCFKECPSSSKLWRSNFFWLGKGEFPVLFTRPAVEPRDYKEQDIPPKPSEYDNFDAVILGSHQVYCRAYSSAVLAFCRVSMAYKPWSALLEFYWAEANPDSKYPPNGPSKCLLFLLFFVFVVLIV